MFENAFLIMLGIAVIVGVGLFVARALTNFYNSRFQRITIYDYEKALHYKDGKLIATLKTGTYRYSPKNEQIVKYDSRLTSLTVPAQEVISKDSVGIKITMYATYLIVNPELLASQLNSYWDTIYSNLQLSLRDVIADRDIETVLTERESINESVFLRVKAELENYGINLQSVSVKDIMFPGNLKQLFAQVAVAKQEGLASLERARGETAALRSLANAAKMMDDNPNLYNLRLIQVLGESSGNTVVVGSSDATNIVKSKE